MAPLDKELEQLYVNSFSIIEPAHDTADTEIDTYRPYTKTKKKLVVMGINEGRFDSFLVGRPMPRATKVRRS